MWLWTKRAASRRAQSIRHSSSLLVGRRRGGISTGRSVGSTSATTVVIGAPIIVRVVVRAIAVRVVVAAATAGISTAGGVVVVALAVGSGTSHDDGVGEMERERGLCDAERSE